MKQEKNPWTLTKWRLWRISIAIWIIGEITAYNLSKIAGDALSTIGIITFFITSIYIFLTMSKKKKRN